MYSTVFERAKKNLTGFFKPPQQIPRADYATWLRLRFMYYYLLASFLIILGVTIILSVITHYGNQLGFKMDLPIYLSLIGLLVLYGVGIYFLKRGHYRVISHTILVVAFTAIWLIIFFDPNGELAKLDSIMYLLVLLSTMPLLLATDTKFILVYALLNLITAGIFSWYYFGAGNLLNEYIIDAGISIVLVGIIAFYNSRINRIALEKVHQDMKARAVAEEQLARSERKYREITELLPQTIFEADISGRLLYVNRKGLEQFGYQQDDLQRGISVFDTLDPLEHERARSNIGRILQGEHLSGNRYLALRKDGETFVAEIYTSLVLEDGKPAALRGLIIDLTERIRTDHELKESQERFKSLVNNIPGITYRCKYDKSWTMLFMSSEIDRLSGYSSSDFINNRVRTYESVIHPDDRENTAVEVDKAIVAGEPWEIEYRVLHRSGSIRWAYEKGQAIPDAEGKVEFLDGVILDITRRKLIENALVQSEDRYRHLFLNSPVALAEVNADGVITGVNKQFTSLLGYTLTDLPTIDLWWLKAYPDKKYRQEVMAIWNRMIQEASSPDSDLSPAEFKVTGKTGQEYTMLIGAALIRDTTLASFVNITDRKKAESDLLESEERYRSLIDAFPDIIMISDYSGNVIFGNRKLEAITGITPADYANPGRKAHIHPDDYEMVRTALLQLIKGNESNSEVIENRFVDALGNTHYFSGIMSRIIWQGQQMIQTVSRDITEKKAIEHELEKHRTHLESLVAERTDELEVKNEELITTNDELQSLNEELLKKNQIINDQNEKLKATLENLKNTQLQLVQSEKMASLGVLTAGIAHEINNPLNFIQGGYEGLADYLHGKKLDKEEKVNILLGSIQTGVERATAIVRSLNQFSRSRESYDENCDIHSIIDNCLLMLKSGLSDRIKVERNYELRHFTVKGNVGKLHQAILNILNNAGQAIHGKGTITLTTELQNENIMIGIHDTGVGISHENIDKVLDPFFTTKEPGEGTGLGLAITYSIVREHMGNLEIQSEPDKGTLIKIILPVS
jgi:PAS domain S-box-containing protein